ncbi:MAG: nucleoside deaminase [Fusobacteriaceae bacterium]
MSKEFKIFKLSLPKWLEEFYRDSYLKKYETQDERMELVIELSKKNIEFETGGPFGAAIFDKKSHELIAVGVNQVVIENISIAHAEIMAIIMAERKFNTYDLGSVREVELVTSSQPCIQCYGALIWAGINKVVIGASGETVKRITGFDEGPLPENWRKELEMRGIEVVTDILSDRAEKILEQYSKTGIIYNSEIQINQKK